jgi:hypothetical protein
MLCATELVQIADDERHARIRKARRRGEGGAHGSRMAVPDAGHLGEGSTTAHENPDLLHTTKTER